MAAFVSAHLFCHRLLCIAGGWNDIIPFGLRERRHHQYR
jgi:hypothetical protein